MRNRRELGELWFHFTSFESNEGSFVAHLITVVWCTEDRDNLITRLNLITFHFYFMWSDTQFLGILNKEIFYHQPRLFSSKNYFATSGPKPVPHPLLLGALPFYFIGSLQSSSHIIPTFGGSLNLSSAWISFKVTPSLLKSPPWVTKTLKIIIKRH